MLPINIHLPDGFLNEEERCGYLVSTEMKKVWAIELDLLNELLSVCKRNGLTVFASDGTMLGAIRHQGFIPWDDDIDMMMYREDYELLCSIAKSEFKEPYFFQTEYSDPGSMRGHAQLRNSLTAAIRKKEKDNCHFNMGIFIDIFPLDNVIEDASLLEKQKKKCDFYKRYAVYFNNATRRYVPCRNKSIKTIVSTGIHSLSQVIKSVDHLPTLFYTKFENECKRYNDRPTEIIAPLSFAFGSMKHRMRRIDYSSFEDRAFEFIHIPVTTHWEDALYRRYGDWHKYEIGTSMHGELVFNTEHSYKEFIK